MSKKCFRLSILAQLLGVVSSSTVFANVEISQSPLTNVSQRYGPNVVLALSVEHPTAKTAYPKPVAPASTNPTGDLQIGILTPEGMKIRYRGYFDSGKCYTYNSSEMKGVFVPTRKAPDRTDGYIGLCNGANEFSGNALNFLTMTAIDVFRSAMTGGNRAYGTETTANSYIYADEDGETYLRRAMANWWQNSFIKQIDVAAFNRSPIKLSDLFPDDYIIVGGQPVNYLQFNNNKVDPRYPIDSNRLPPGSVTGFDVLIERSATGSTGNVIGSVLHAVVKVCVPGLLEDNCHQYGPDYRPHYKPEGLLQQYGRLGMRVAVVGYLRNDYKSESNSSVLRARMKDLTQKQSALANGWTYNFNPEWNSRTGVFDINPDKDDADKTSSWARASIGNSGVINYLNKFGDLNGYKVYDPGAELYYTALRYLRHGAWKGTNPDYQTTNDTTAAPYPYQDDHTILTSTNQLDPDKTREKQADGFPVIYDWDDPLIDSHRNNANGVCRQNNIIFIGDTNTWYDQNLPHYDSRYNNFDDDINTQFSLLEVLNAENSKYNVYYDMGAGYETGNGNSPAGIAGLAYWARTNDLRPDIPGTQLGNNFMVDVVESGEYKGGITGVLGGAKGTIRNSYYLAAKYGGFDGVLDADHVNSNRKSWTDDPAGTTSIADFPDGVPRNYAAANNPDNMQAALKKAFRTVNSNMNTTSQAAPSFNGAGQQVNLHNGTLITLQTSFIPNVWSGNVTASTVNINNNTNQTTPSKLWDAASLLDSQYHNSTNWKKRKIWIGGDWLSSTATAGSLAAYIMGDDSQEDKKYRRRKSLLGSVVNSSVATILPRADADNPAHNTFGCHYANPNTVKNRDPAYAFAANDGLFHLLNKDGYETWAYLPNELYNHLADRYKNYASDDYEHEFLNDGTPVTAELCDIDNGKTYKTYVVGTTGRGGRSVYAIDATDPNNPVGLWDFNAEHSDHELGLTVSKPVLSQDRQGHPIAIFSSGYNSNSAHGYLYVMNIHSGTLIKKISLGGSGVGAPFGYDENNDGVVDRVYVGDHDGYLWRIDQDAAGNWAAPAGLQNGGNAKPLFKTDDNRPIMGAPYVETIKGKTYVVFGTGEYFNAANLDSGLQNYAYGLFDEGTQITDHSKLVNQSITTNNTLNNGTNVTYYQVTNNKINNDSQGWRLALLKGQNISSAASIFRHHLAEFYAVRTTGKGTCGEQQGATALISVDIVNGGLFQTAPVFDTNNDGEFTPDDGDYGMAEVDGVMTPEGTTVDAGTEVVTVIDTGTAGMAVIHRNPFLNGPASIHRISWREITQSYTH